MRTALSYIYVYEWMAVNTYVYACMYVFIESSTF